MEIIFNIELKNFWISNNDDFSQIVLNTNIFYKDCKYFNTEEDFEQPVHPIKKEDE